MALKTKTGIPEACCTLDLKGKELERFLLMCKAASGPQRWKILQFLLTHPGCITGDIVDHLPIAQATVSQHLRVLRDAGWVRGTVSGPAVNYCLDDENIAWFKEKVNTIL